MKVSYNWLREYVTMDRTAAEVAEMLTMSGLEVDEVDLLGAPLEGVVVGEVGQVDPHPNADRLNLCVVDVGGDEPLRVVCGAPNVAPGQRVPVALVGTTLQLPTREDPTTRQPVTIRRSKIRGEASEGMICAEDELGLSEDHSGIMVLAPDAPVGMAFADYLATTGVQVSDAVLDVAVTPNRPDAVSHVGVARDLAALMRVPLRRPEVKLPENGGAVAGEVTVDIRVPTACPRYAAILVRGVAIKESPAWLKHRLTAVGLRPRNNVVDVTNFVMYECGQPLHAFDFDQVADASIEVRFSEPGERFTTLDGKTRPLPEETMLICDAKRPIAIAGIMGGENSEVSDVTTNVLIESAYFDPSIVRRAARRLGLQTDASYRFERGVDADGQVWAAARAAELIVSLAGGQIVPGVVDAHPLPAPRRVVELRSASVNRVLGVDLPLAEGRRLLEAIGFEVSAESEEVIRCTIPTFRPDIEREIDVIEEVARLYGFDQIPEPEHMRIPSNVLPHQRAVDRVRARVRDVLRGDGYREIFTNSLLSAETAQRFLEPAVSFMGDGEPVATLNPISQEMASLRTSLLPGALEVLRHNANRGARRLLFFETGHIFRGGVSEPSLVPGYREEESLLLVGAGLRRETAWHEGAQELDFYDIKGTVEKLLHACDIPDLKLVPRGQPTSLTRFHIDVFCNGTHIGSAGSVESDVAHAYDLEDGVVYAELSIDRLTAASRLADPVRLETVSRFPRVVRDLAVLLDREQDVGPILDEIRRAGGDLLQEARPFDLYTGRGVPEGRKSVAFSLVFGADRTLTDDEVDARVDAIIRKMGDEFSADLRR